VPEVEPLEPDVDPVDPELEPVDPEVDPVDPPCDGDCEPEDGELAPPPDDDGELEPELPLEPDDPPDDDGGIELGIVEELVVLQPDTATATATMSNVDRPWMRFICGAPCVIDDGGAVRTAHLVGCAQSRTVHCHTPVRASHPRPQRRRPSAPRSRRPESRRPVPQEESCRRPRS
jgi:hypothetical protein